jgi:hypothetical protein
VPTKTIIFNFIQADNSFQKVVSYSADRFKNLIKCDYAGTKWPKIKGLSYSQAKDAPQRYT